MLIRIVDTSISLATTQQETTNFTVRLLIKSDWSMLSSAPECSKQLPLRQYIVNWGGGGGSWGIVSTLKSLQKQLQRRHKLRYLKIHRYTSPKIDVVLNGHFNAIAPTEDNVRVSFLVHQVPRTSATVLRHRRMFTQFSLHA